ncbi:glutamine amidotransferase [Candidatus Palauibacter sp.]|uniref:glutamine amidotransferase n=1 Tax=Candidatus Palauibacter sp. TaxID=3101350 RepID=UPI003B5234F7
MFEFLFKYRPVVFERGDLSLAAPWWGVILVFLGVGAVVWFALEYRRVGPTVEARDRWVLMGLRAAALGVLAFLLLRPVLLVSTVVPRRNFVAVLLDDSRSMRVADENGATRAQRMLDLFGGAEEDAGDGTADPPADPLAADPGVSGSAAMDPATAAPGDGRAFETEQGEGALRKALEDRFRLRMYGFDSDADRIDAAGELAFTGPRTNLAAGLTRVQQEMAGLPLSGIVVVSDGADNDDEAIPPLSEALLSARAAGIPIYTIGMGAERIAPDVEVRRVEVPRAALEGTTIVADVIVSHAGLAGRTVRLDVEDEGRIVGTHNLTLGPDGEEAVQLQFTLEEPGPRAIRFFVDPQEGEALTGNNERQVLVEVGDTRRKILYFEGSPRPENKFVRRAVAEDENLHVVTLLRTADEKYLRLDVEGPGELAGGFPATREELYEYDGLILGSVEASFFTHDQLQMMADFVAQRGGGLLVLGGRRSLGEGGYSGTPLADALPVVLEGAGEPDVLEVSAELTLAGQRHAAMRIAETAEASGERWTELPSLTSVNRVFVTGLKPGAVDLLRGVPADGEPRLLLAHQRYGRGTSIVFATQDSWLWQMHADIPLEDETHETLWRQLLRWLVHDTPGRIQLDSGEDVAPMGEPLRIRADVEDERYLRVNGADVVASVTGPDGTESEVRLDWTVERDGEYEGRFVPREPGLYSVQVRAEGARIGGAGAGAETSRDIAEEMSFFRAGTPRIEEFGAGRRTELLRRIADETGGRFYTADEAQVMADEILYTESGDTVYEERSLWDMPILFLLLAGLLGGEWAYRRRKDLA